MRIWGTGILNSIRISLRAAMRGPITVQYPHEKLDVAERGRWAVTMTLDENGDHKCIACLACERACPDYIIKIDVTTGEDRSKHIDHWNYQLGACMMCGLCVEACTVDAIHMGKDYELATTDVGDLTYDLLTDVPAARIKRAERPDAPKPKTQQLCEDSAEVAKADAEADAAAAKVAGEDFSDSEPKESGCDV